MKSPVFVITIDTEGDNLWSNPRSVSTDNAGYLSRFQHLCENFGFKPTYLVNYEMAADRRFQALGRYVVRNGLGEIGCHLHAWNSPPLEESPDSRMHQIYAYELHDELLYAKMNYLHRLLMEVFEVRPISHRAGRYGFNERVARVINQLGYLVDCSVTPGLSWAKRKGAPTGNGGPDFTDFPLEPYFIDIGNIKRHGNSELLEVPITVKPNYPSRVCRFDRWAGDKLVGRVFQRIMGPSHTWLRPNGGNIHNMLELVEWAYAHELPLLEFMLHSSELMPGGSPTFQSAVDIEELYNDLQRLFSRLTSLGCINMTLAEYRLAFMDLEESHTRSTSMVGLKP